MIRSVLTAACRFAACALLLFSTGANAQAQVDATTLNNKIMAGYQGWFLTPDQAVGASWRHWSRSGVVPDASSVSVDMWPDLREFAASELTATGFKYADGSTAGLYSSFNAASVERHVKWMRDYGIDGVFVQRFVVEAVQMRAVRDKVLQNVRAGAEKHGRVFANMYDISGADASTLVADIKNDWIHLVDNLQVTASSRYLRHEGLPVVSIWGFGVGGRPGSAEELQALITWFKTNATEKYRATVKLGVDPDWRTHGTAWQTAYRSVAVLSPWTVGRYTNDAGADAWRNDKVTPDLNALSGSGTGYMPVVFPGFSGTNLTRGAKPMNQIPRRGGRFFWRQTYNAIQAGANMVYVAMFDEVDEGTAMFKIAENSSQIPTSGKFLPLNADGETVPSDWYLSLMGEASRMLRGERALSATMPPIGGVAPVPVEPVPGSLITGQRLTADQTLPSANGVYRLTLKTDGNLVIYNASSQPLWDSTTAGRGAVRLELQGDGNLVLYTSAGAAVWASGTNGSGAARLVMQDDGDLVLETAAGVSVWSTGTGQSSGVESAATSAAVVHATKGGVNLTKSNVSVGSPARSGDYEIVAVAGSSVQGGTNAPIDRALMTDQGFQLVGVRGEADRKSEVWIRKNNGSSGQASIRITGKGPDVLWSITTIDGSKSQLNLSSIQTANTFASHGNSSASFSAPGGSGLLFVAMLFDDPVEVLSAGSGSILYKTWGSGDGNGIASLLFQPGVSVPGSVNIKNYDSQGRQYAVVAARIAVTPLGGGTADTTPPVITLNGSTSMTVTKGSSFSDPGAAATDNKDGDVSVNVTGSVNVSVVGTYTLQYNARDLAGNNATTLTRTVNVINASGGGSGPGTSNLKTDQTLSTNQFIVSANGSHKFVLQSDGNLVVYSSGQLRWAAATQGKGGTQLFLKGDGNLVLRTASGAAVWRTGTNGKGAVRLVMQDDGNLVLLTAAGGLVWSTNTGDGGTADTTPPVITLNGATSMTVTKGGIFSDPGATATDNKDGNVSVKVTGSVNVAVVGTYTLLYDARDAAGNNAVTVTRTVSVVNPSSGPGTPVLQTDQRLSTNQFIESANGAYKFVLQGDGNLVLYTSARQVRWTATTQGKGGTQLFLQGDGNLVLRTAAGAAVWNSATVGKGAVRLVLQDDGNLVLQTAAGATVWSTNTGGGTPPPPVDGRARVAFVGDSGSGGNFQNVLNLIKSEGAEMTMFLGDTSYSSSGDDAWNDRIRATLAATDPVLLAIGNHDVEDSNLDKVVSLSQARLDRQSAVKCNGTYGQRMTCTYKNLYFVVSGIGTIGSDSDQENFIASSLNNAPANTWRICAWHKNQHLMQVGEKSNETGWTAYETCRQKGALIATGHEHSYSRTHLLSNMTKRTVDSTSSTFTVSPGKSFAFVSGLGGQSIRPQLLSGNWWAKVYTTNQGAKYGVLFADFYADRADFYFKNIDGQVIDQFTVKKGY